MRWPLLLLAAALAACAGPPAPAPEVLPPLGLELVADGFERPVFAVERSGLLYVVEQSGAVWMLEGGTRLADPFVDLRGSIAARGEQGLLGMAFREGFVYLHFTDLTGDSVLQERSLGCGGRCTLEPRELLRVPQPYTNHNGGMVAFGPDGHLYIALGDGGAAGDPDNHAQDLGSLLGKILRIDPRGASQCETCPPYEVPGDNPFVDHEGARPEIWAYGLRNPWRFSFDRATGDLWIGDVGQNAWEEVDVLRAGQGGANLGWSRFEGTHIYDASRSAPDPVAPLLEYPRGDGTCAVTGGYVYRGAALPALRGTYVFSDYCAGKLWGTRNGEQTELLATQLRVSSFGEDGRGELLVLHHGGSIHRLVAMPAAG
jgi:glucose/arabinose dehydrogenase